MNYLLLADFITSKNSTTTMKKKEEWRENFS